VCVSSYMVLLGLLFWWLDSCVRLLARGYYNSTTGQLTWLVYLIGSVIGGRISYLNADDSDAMDGQLVCRWALC